jgi:predicted nucleotidyltransferase
MRLAEATDAKAIILFGSRARGDNDDESDWDLCVILPDHVEWGRFTPVTLWPLVSDLGIPIQVVPIRRSVFEAKKSGINNLSHDIARDGMVIHGRLDRADAL